MIWGHMARGKTLQFETLMSQKYRTYLEKLPLSRNPPNLVDLKIASYSDYLAVFYSLAQRLPL